eukprot:m.98917 g.98917  ORF g.98917 m.98917 type:complete len:613 (-) comp22138_c0_seq1:57-1895(-)
MFLLLLLLMSFSLKTLYVSGPTVERGRPLILKGDPKGKNFIYTNGNQVIIRNLENPTEAFTYTGHAQKATVAAYAPSGFYIASCDASGVVRIWDTTQEEHMLKYEYRPLSGAIKDIAWSPDSKRIVVGGEGRDEFGRCFLWDSGSSVGQIVGHSKSLNSVDYRSIRPFRVVTGSEDNDIGFFAGPPFKRDQLIKNHTKFVHIVRFSGDGLKFATASFDGKATLFDGKTAEKIGDLGGEEHAHSAGINALCWSPDSKRILTASGDCTCKVWDAEALSLLTTFTFGEGLEHQQLGCLWQGDILVSVSLDGYINYLDLDNPDKPKKILQGHNKSITALKVDAANNCFYTASYDGLVACYQMGSAEPRVFGNSHTNQVTSLQLDGDKLISASMDDTIKITPASSDSLSDDLLIKCDSGPVGMNTVKGLTAVACLNHLFSFQDGKKGPVTEIKYVAQDIAVSPNGAEAAVPGKDGNVHFYALDGGNFKELTSVNVSSREAVCASYSPDGKFVAVGDSNREVFVLNAESKEIHIQGWQFHTAKVNTVAWSPDSKHIATGSLDTGVIVWSVANKTKKLKMKGIHPTADVTKVEWFSDNVLVTVGADNCIRTWDIKHADE